MKEFFETVWMYWGSWKLLLLEAACGLFLFCRRKKRNAFRVIICLFAAMLIFVYNPLSRWIWTKVVAPHLYWRMFWLFPAVPVAAFAFTELMGSFSGKKRIAVFAALCAMIVLCGKNVYFNNNFQIASNKFKIPQDAAMVSNYLVSQGEKTKALVPDSLSCYIRQYSSGISLLYGRDIFGFTSPVTTEDYYKIHDAMEEEELRVKFILKKARKYHCEYVVLDNRKKLRANPEKLGFVQQTVIGNYTVYRDADGIKDE